MLTIRQFADFLNMLRSGQAYDGSGKISPKQELDQILDEILTVRVPWRAEWLDAKFTPSGEKYNITYHEINPDRTLEQVTKPLEDCLMEDKTQGIDLNHWLQHANTQGLPPSSTPQGALYYWHPVADRVAMFGADSCWVDLLCSGYPRSSDAVLGVRVARVK